MALLTVPSLRKAHVLQSVGFRVWSNRSVTSAHYFSNAAMLLKSSFSER